MKTLVFSAPFLFALLAAASLDNLIDTRAVNPDLRRFLPRGNVVIPSACYRRKQAPADVGSIPTVTRYESAPTRTTTAVSGGEEDEDEDEEEKFETTASSFSTGSSSTLSSSVSSASASRATSVSNGSSAKEPVSEDEDEDTDRVSSSTSSASAAITAGGQAAGGNDAIVVNSVPSPVAPNNGAAGAAAAAVTSNEAIVVVSVPTPVVAPNMANKTYGNAAVKVNSKRSSHRSHSRPKSHPKVFSDIDVDVVHSSTEVIILDDYIDFDWTDWKSSICLIDTGDKDGWDEQFGCTTWGSFDGKLAFHADADPCLQQHFADVMITYAKRFGGRQRNSWIKQVLKYRRHPRKVIKTLGIYPSTPYCLERPLNKELRGIWNAQLKGVDFGIYGGPNYDLKAFGDVGTCPLGLKADTEACGCVHDPDFRWEEKNERNSEVQDCLRTCNSKYSPFAKRS